MSGTSSPLTSVKSLGVDTRHKPTEQAVEAGRFDAMLFQASSAGTTLNDLVNGLIEHIIGSRGINAAGQSITPAPKFPFSPAFEATFGLSGPLPVYITLITSKLNLNAVQNQALQDISIRNKDIVKTPETVQQLAQELRAAGIPPVTA